MECAVSSTSAHSQCLLWLNLTLNGMVVFIATILRNNMSSYNFIEYGLTQEQVKDKIHYDPDTGIFTWLRGRNRGKEAGQKNGNGGYIRIYVLEKGILAHRLAVFYMTGDWPANIIDHINRDRSDNRWCNLRVVTPRENMCNMITNNDVVGVRYSFDKRHDSGNWHAQYNTSEKRYSRTFSCKKYGFDEAKQMAIGVRKQWEELYA